MKFVRIVLACLIATIASPVKAGINEVVFIGITSGGAPAIEKTFDKKLRQQLSIQPSIKAADYIKTQQFSRFIRFEDFINVSRELVESIERIASDTTLFVWGRILRNTVTPKREKVFQVVLKNELEIELSIYSLTRKEFAYTGKIHSESSKRKGLILFGPLKKYVHIDALERTELLEVCIENAVQKSIDIINTIIRNQTIDNVNVKAENIDQYKVPSISDVFSVPSIEARDIESESPAPDTVGN